VTLLFREMPQRLLVCSRWIRGWCWLCAFSSFCCGFMSEQNLNSTRCMSLSFGGICLGSKCLPLPSMGITNTPSGRLWCLFGRFCCVGKTQSGMFLSMSSGSSMLRSDNFSLLQASIVTIAEPACLYWSLHHEGTKENCVVVSVYVHSFQSMVVAPKKYVWSNVWSSA